MRNVVRHPPATPSPRPVSGRTLWRNGFDFAVIGVGSIMMGRRRSLCVSGGKEGRDRSALLSGTRSRCEVHTLASRCYPVPL